MQFNCCILQAITKCCNERMGGQGISGDYEGEKVSTCTAGSCVLIWPNGKLRVCMWHVAGSRWQVAGSKKKGSQRVKLVAKAQGKVAAAGAQQGKLREASLSLLLPWHKRHFNWQPIVARLANATRRVALQFRLPRGCNYLGDIFQIIRKYAKIAAHAHFGRRGNRKGRVSAGRGQRPFKRELYELCPKDDDSSRLVLQAARPATHCRIASLHCTLRSALLCFCAAVRYSTVSNS